MIIAGNPSITGSISDESLFFTLPTRGLTGQHIMSSVGKGCQQLP